MSSKAPAGSTTASYTFRTTSEIPTRTTPTQHALAPGPVVSPSFLPADTSPIPPPGDFFMLLWLAVLLFILWGMFKSRGAPTPANGTPRPPRSWPWSGFGGGPGSVYDPPPPYPGSDPSPKPSASASGWAPGFWTGTALGAAGTYLMGQGAAAGNRRYDRGGLYRDSRAYDWERERSSSGPRRGFSSDDRGEGPSNLGATRRSTGFGGSNVR